MRLCIFVAIAALAGCSDSSADPAADAGNGSFDGGSDRDGGTVDAMVDCNAAINCAQPGGSAYSLCGRILDVEDDTVIAEPTSVGLAVYDAVDFTNDPANATPLNATDVTIDSCGRFRAVDVAEAGTGTVILALDDDGDAYVTSATAMDIELGERITDIGLRAVRTATNETWSSQGGFPPGGSFARSGAWIAIFSHNGQPVEGVELMRGIDTVPSDSFYFGDQDGSRTTISTSVGATGLNGTGVMIESPLQTHSGTGAEPMGCEWPSVLAVGLEDVFFVTEMPMVVADSDDACP
jgi:hypothetical protein